MIKPTLFIHCGTASDRYVSIMKEFEEDLNASKFKDAIDVRVCSVGDPKPDEKWFNIDYHHNDFSKGEFFTLEKIRNFCKQVGVGIPVGYVHTKGVFNGFDNPCIIEWRQYMSYFILQKAQDCIESLKDHDVVGVDWVTEPNKHFSGHFWWANSQYINRLPQIDPPNFWIDKCPSTRHLAEFWIGYGFPRVKCLHSSGINVYERHLNRYPREKYVITN
jgi:hypothetical protein